MNVIMKYCMCALFVLILLSGSANGAFSLVETFDSGGGGWATSPAVGTSTFNIVTDGSGKHLQAFVVRDVNDGTGRYTKALGSTLDISDVNDSLYLEADVQVVDGFNNFGSIHLGLGKSGDSFKNQMLVRLYWDGTTGADRYSIYGAIYDSNSDTNRPPLSVTGGDQVGMAGLPYRIKAQFSNKKDIADVNRLSYDVKVYRINEDGSTGSLVGDTNAIQTTGLTSLSVDQVGIFITNADKAQSTVTGPRFLTANIDNVRVSDTGFSASSAIPSWYNFTTSDTDIYETFTADPTGTWTTVAPAGSGASFTWKQRASDGYMDVVLVRDTNDPTKSAKFYRNLGTGKEFIIDNLDTSPEAYGIYWFVECDVYVVDMDSFAEGLIGTGFKNTLGTIATIDYTLPPPYSAAVPPYNHINLLAGSCYGAQELGNGMRAEVVGWSVYLWPPTRRAVTVAGMLVPGKSYRIKCAAAQRYDSAATNVGRRTRMIGSVYTINPDGTDGNLVATDGEWHGGGIESLYADVMGIFSTMQTTTTSRTMNLYVDNIHFSTVGFKLDGVMPAWMVQPTCSELAIAGDTNADCLVDKADLKIMADNWLKVGN
jgi:hypothetical protein